jgi:hypothetical protein
MKLLLAVMRAQRNNSNIDLGIVDLVNHAILLVSTAYAISYSELINAVMSSLLSRRVNLAPG